MSQVETPAVAPPSAEVTTEPTSEFNEDSLIASIVAKHESAISREQLLGEDVTSLEETPPATPPAPKADEAVGEPITDAPKEDEKPLSLSARKIQMLAAKEKELREREQALKGKETNEAELIRKLLDNPEELLAKSGLTADQVATLLWNRSLGEDAPEDFKRKANSIKEKSRVDALEQKLEEARRMAEEAQSTAAQNARIEIYDDGIRRFSRSIPEELHFLRTEAQSDPDGAYQAIAHHVAGQMFDSEGKMKPSSEWPSPEEAARAVNDAMKADWERFAPKPTAPTTPTTESHDRESYTLTEADNLHPTRLPPDRKEYSDDDWEKLALHTIQRAMREGVS